MKKAITIPLLLIFAAFHPSCAKAQIQLSTDDLCRKGQFHMAIDTIGNFDPGTPGPNKVWDFSNLKKHTIFQYSIVDYNGNGSGNDANLAKVDGTDTFEYILKSGSELFRIIPLQDFDKVVYQKQRTFSCPLKYNDVINDSVIMIALHPGIIFGMPSYDSIRLTYKTIYTCKSDAWGVLKLPTSDLNTIRLKSESRTIAWLEGKNGSQAYTILHAYDYDESTIEYTWFAKDKGNYVAAYNPEDAEVQYMVSAVLSSGSLQKNIDIVIANPIGDEMKIRNTGGSNCRISLFDMSGKLVFSEMIQSYSEQAINTAGLLSGVYYVEIYNIETQNIQIEKLVK